MNVVDSSAWLSYFAGEKNAGYFAAAIEDAEILIVPSICLYEVFKVVLREKGKDAALSVAACMQLGRVVDLDPNLAREAATVGVEKGLALAESIIYAVTKLNDAVYGLRTPISLGDRMFGIGGSREITAPSECFHILD